MRIILFLISLELNVLLLFLLLSLQSADHPSYKDGESLQLTSLVF